MNSLPPSPLSNRESRVQQMLMDPKLNNKPKYYTRRPGLENRNAIRRTIRATQAASQNVKPTFWNYVGKASNFLTRRKNIPSGSLQKAGRRRLKEYELRALSELSYRSPKVVASNLKTLKNKSNKKNLTRALKQSRSKTKKLRRSKVI